MSLQIRKDIKRIAALLAAAGMMMGLVSPSAFDELCNDLHRLNGQPYEISCVNTGITHDCIDSEGSVSRNQFCPRVRRSGSAGAALFRLSGGDSACSSYTVFINHLFILLLSSLLFSAALSYYHIIFIHLKDGQK